jgi:hypothetical protein
MPKNGVDFLEIALYIGLMSNISLIGTAEAAEILGQSRSNFQLLAQKNIVRPFARVGKRRTMVFDRKEIERLAAARRGAKDA